MTDIMTGYQPFTGQFNAGEPVFGETVPFGVEGFDKVFQEGTGDTLDDALNDLTQQVTENTITIVYNGQTVPTGARVYFQAIDNPPQENQGE